MNEAPTVDDRGFLYGDGLFETVRVEEGEARFLDRHLRRFERSAKSLGFPDEAREAGAEALRAVEGRDDGLWRVTVTRPGDGEVFGGGPGTVAVRHRPLPGPPEGDGLAVTVLEGTYFPGDRLAEHKTTNWLRGIVAMKRARSAGFDEAVRVSYDGRVGEAAAANLFARVGDGWATPPVDGILPGVVREVVLERAEQAGVEVEERPLFVGDLQTAQSVALTSAGRLVTPVRAIDGQSLEVGAVEELEELVAVGE